MFINNSPVVAMFAGAVQDWCKRSGFNASHFLLPLSYASIMGGTCTLISMFPIAMSGAQSLDVSTAPFAVAVMIAASASFVTPIGYQTNLMVFGPGGYRFSDYVKLSLPLSLLVAGIALWIIPQVWAF